MKVLTLQKLRDLNVATPTTIEGPPHLSAASGLVIVNSIAYIVADDEQHLGVFSLTNNEPGCWFRIFEGDLPADKTQRKKAKADLEALVLLPSVAGYPHSVLFAVGSGSKRNRQRGALLPLDAHGVIAGAPRLIDLQQLFAAIERQVGDLNVEGAVAANGRLNFLQRGNKGAGISAVISLPLDCVLQSLSTSDRVGELPFAIRQYDLGVINGIPLGFTDGAALPDGRIVFTAVAEDSASSYSDGPCAGAAVGILGTDGQLESLDQLSPNAKVEGLDARVMERGIELYLVTDADDPCIAASLYSTTICRD